MNRQIERQILDLYRRYPQPRTFAEDVELHAHNGVAIVVPNFVMLVRPVNIFDQETKYIDLNHRYKIDDCNCWYVWLYAGISQNNPCNMVPLNLPYWAWSRRGNPPKVYQTQKIKSNLIIKP